MDQERLDRVLADVGDVTKLPMDDLRSRRAEAQELEVVLSYQRRVAAVAGVPGEDHGGHRPEALELRLVGDLLGDHRHPAQPHVGVGPEVVVPAGVARAAGVRRHEDRPLAVPEADDGVPADLPRPRAPGLEHRRREDERRGEAAARDPEHEGVEPPEQGAGHPSSRPGDGHRGVGADERAGPTRWGPRQAPGAARWRVPVDGPADDRAPIDRSEGAAVGAGVRGVAAQVEAVAVDRCHPLDDDPLVVAGIGSGHHVALPVAAAAHDEEPVPREQGRRHAVTFDRDEA